MDHLAQRLILPALFFWTPILFGTFFLSGLTLDQRVIAAFVFLAGPFGFFVYHDFRVGWLRRGVYESMPFCEVLRDQLIRVYDVQNKLILLNLEAVNPEYGTVTLTHEEFVALFCRPKVVNMDDQFNQDTFSRLPRVEPIADLLLFSNNSYDYASSIASVRYAIDGCFHGFLLGLLVTVPLCVLIAAAGLAHGAIIPAFREDFPLTWKVVVAVSAIVLSALLVRTLYKVWLRRKHAKEEHSARLFLIVVATSRIHRVVENTYALSPTVHDAVEALPKTADSQFAIFDMDNTLFVGDIGEGLLAFLVSKGMLLESVWVEYKRLLNESRLTPEQRCFNAYSFASIALSGMAPAQVAQATVEMIDLPGESFNVGSDVVRKPSARPELKNLILDFVRRRIRCFVVTATNEWAARAAIWRAFGINKSDVIGVRNVLRHGVLTSQLEEPAPIGNAKMICFRHRTGVVGQPVVVAGDSANDHALMVECQKEGVVFYYGDEAEYNAVFPQRPIALGQKPEDFRPKLFFPLRCSQ